MIKKIKIPKFNFCENIEKYKERFEKKYSNSKFEKKTDQIFSWAWEEKNNKCETEEKCELSFAVMTEYKYKEYKNNNSDNYNYLVFYYLRSGTKREITDMEEIVKNENYSKLYLNTHQKITSIKFGLTKISHWAHGIDEKIEIANIIKAWRDGRFVITETKIYNMFINFLDDVNYIEWKDSLNS